jgi:hypothetical protein
MADLLMLLIVLVFFVLCVAYVSLCDRIIGPDIIDTDVASGSDGATTAVGDLEGAAR